VIQIADIESAAAPGFVFRFPKNAVAEFAAAEIAKQVNLFRVLRDECGEIESAVTVTRATLEEATARARRLMFELRPSILHEHGIIPAVNVLADETRRETGARTEVRGSVGRYGHDVEELVYRSLQEALANVRKHAGAERAWVQIGQRGVERLVVVRDDGSGFAGDTDPGGQGLRNLRERAAAIGGVFALSSTPGQGTALEVTLRA